MAGETANPSRLAPIGECITDPVEAANAVQLVYQRRAAIQQSLSRPLRIAASCRKVATWGEDTDWPDECRTIVHRIRQGIETQVASHLKEPVQATADPTQTGEYAKWYWCAPMEVAIELAQMGFPLDPMYVGGAANGEIFTPEPLPLALVMQYRQLSQAQPDIFDPQYICKLTDEYRCKTIQKQFDADWRDAGVDEWLHSRVYACIQEGWELPLFEYDPEMHLPVLGFNSIEQTYIDQSVERVSIGKVDIANEAGIDLYIDVEEALRKFPEHRDAILTSSGQESVTAPGNGGTVPVQYRGQFGRPMLPMIVWWIRNRPVNVPMSEQEALDGGHVIPSVHADLAGQNQPLDAGTDGEFPPTGAPDPGGSIPAASYVLAATGVPVTPDNPEWPTKTEYRIHRLTIIDDTLVGDEVNPFPWLNILHLRNTLVTGRPWGIGEPFYGRKLQDIITDITQAGADHIQYNAHPAVTMPQGLKDSMEREFGKAFVDPNLIIGLPSPYDTMEKPPIRIIEPAPFPEANLRILEFTTEEFNRVTYQSDVMSGEIPSTNASGTLVANLQSQASEPLQFKAQEITYCVEKLSRLMIFCVLHFKPIELISKTTGVPVPLLHLIIEGLKGQFPNPNVTVSTGSGQTNAKKIAQMVQLNQTVSPDTKEPLVSAKSVREMLPIDGPTEERRNEEALRRMATITAPMQGQAATAAAPVAEGNGHSNGNGRFQ